MQSQQSSVCFSGNTYRLYGRYYRKSSGSGEQYLHRAIWEMHHGKIPDGFHVHHIDGNPLNNAIENLEAIDGREHNREHGLKAPHLRSKERRELLDRIRSKSHGWLRFADRRRQMAEKVKATIAAKEKQSRRCEECNEEFQTAYEVEKYCSLACRRAVKNARRRIGNG